MIRFIDAIAFQAFYRPDAIAVDFPGQADSTLTYQALVRATESIAHRLVQRGVHRNSTIALQIQDKFLAAITVIACARFGIATTSLSARHGALADIAIITDDATAIEAASIVIDRLWLFERADHPPAAATDPHALCRIMTTSGSTGRPKSVVLTYDMVQQRLDSYVQAFGPDFARMSRMMCAMPLSSSLGFGFLFYILARGGVFCGDSDHFPTIKRCLIDREIELFVTSPYTLAELMDYESDTLPRLPMVLTAGSRTAPGLTARIRNSLADSLITFYGTTEAGVIASCWWEAAGDVAGRVVAGRRADILDASGRHVQVGEVGRVVISAAPSPLPFYDDPIERGEIVSFAPGDLGFIDFDGVLHLLGREDNVLNVGGTKMLAEDLETAIGRAAGVRDCGIALKPDEFGIDRVVCALVLAAGFDQDKFLAHCEANVLRDFLPTTFTVVPAIPRTGNRKVDRAGLARLF